MARRRGRGGGDESCLFDGSGYRLSVGVCHFVIVIVGAFDVGGCFFVVFDGGGWRFALAALLGGGKEEAGFYG